MSASVTAFELFVEMPVLITPTCYFPFLFRFCFQTVQDPYIVANVFWSMVNKLDLNIMVIYSMIEVILMLEV